MLGPMARPPAKCHPDRPHYGKGLCKPCWAKWRRAKGLGPRATCHPERLHVSNGLCQNCWDASRTKHRGISQTMKAEYLGPVPRCDICQTTDPGNKKGWAIDHDAAHGCAGRYGCVDCVRGMLCHYCNSSILGGVERALALGLLDSVDGVVGEYLDDPPFQAWRLLRDEEATDDQG